MPITSEATVSTKSTMSTMSTMSIASVVGNCHLPAVLPWHLSRVLHWPLLALPLSACLAPGSTGVTVGGISIGFGLSLGLGLWCSFSFPLSISMSSVTANNSSTDSCNPMASSDQLTVVTNNTRGVVDTLAHLVALLGDNVLAVLDIGGVHDSVVLSVADGPGHLAGVLDGSLLALPFSSGMALGAAGVAVRSIGSICISFGLGISFPLSITVSSMASMTSRDELAVVSNNSGAGVNPLAHLVALLSDNILAVLDVGGVHDHVILLVTNLPRHLSGVLDGSLLALSLSPGLALGSTGVTMRAMSIGRISLGISLSLSLSLPLAITMSSITSVASVDQLAVVTNHVRAVVDPLVHLVALLGDDVLAVFDVGGVDDCLVGLMTLLVAVAGDTSGNCSEAGKGDKELHTDC